MLHYRRPADTYDLVSEFAFTNSQRVASLSFFGVWIFLPIITLYPALISQDHFEYIGFQRVFGDLVSNLRRDTLGQLFYNFMFLIRRIVIAIVALDLKDYSSQQLQVLMILNLLYLIYQGKSKPFFGKANNFFALLNEFAIGLILICFVIFTQYCPNKETQYSVGWAEILILAIMLLVNLGR